MATGTREAVWGSGERLGGGLLSVRACGEIFNKFVNIPGSYPALDVSWRRKLDRLQAALLDGNLSSRAVENVEELSVRDAASRRPVPAAKEAKDESLRPLIGDLAAACEARSGVRIQEGASPQLPELPLPASNAA